MNLFNNKGVAIPTKCAHKHWSKWEIAGKYSWDEFYQVIQDRRCLFCGLREFKETRIGKL